MSNFTGWLGEFQAYESLKPEIKEKVDLIRIFLVACPESTLPYLKKVLEMHPNNKHIGTPEYLKKGVISVYVQEYMSSPRMLTTAGYREFNIGELAIYLATRTRFFSKWKEYLNQ